MDFSDIVTRDIDQRFCYIKYDTFDLTTMKENGFIDATKLYKLGGKEFKKWIYLDGSKELIKTVEETNNFWKIKPTRPDMAQLEYDQSEFIINIPNEGTNNKKYEVARS